MLAVCHDYCLEHGVYEGHLTFCFPINTLASEIEACRRSFKVLRTFLSVHSSVRSCSSSAYANEIYH
jgi:hypothetical protein